MSCARSPGPEPMSRTRSPSLSSRALNTWHRCAMQEPTTKRCTIVEERPAPPGVGVVIGGICFGVRAEAESRMRTVEECRESAATGGGVTIEERERVRSR
jgi:hypothetical protein